MCFALRDPVTGGAQSVGKPRRRYGRKTQPKYEEWWWYVAAEAVEMTEAIDRSRIQSQFVGPGGVVVSRSSRGRASWIGMGRDIHHTLSLIHI